MVLCAGHGVHRILPPMLFPRVLLLSGGIFARWMLGFVIRFARYSVVGVQPGSQVNQLAPLRAKGEVLRQFRGVALRYRHAALTDWACVLPATRRLTLVGVVSVSHPGIPAYPEAAVSVQETRREWACALARHCLGPEFRTAPTMEHHSSKIPADSAVVHYPLIMVVHLLVRGPLPAFWRTRSSSVPTAEPRAAPWRSVCPCPRRFHRSRSRSGPAHR